MPSRPRHRRRPTRVSAAVLAFALPVAALAAGIAVDLGGTATPASAAPAAPASGPAVISDAFPTRAVADAAVRYRAGTDPACGGFSAAAPCAFAQDMR